jgi:hypothetical protein
MYQISTFDANLVELIVDRIFNKYRCNANREHFKCDIGFAIHTVNSIAIIVVMKV